VATVPSQTTLVVGAVLTSAVWNANVRDAVNFLLAPPMAVLRATSTQSIPDGTLTALNFDSEDKDTDSGHSTISNTSRYTSQTTGWYEMDGTYSFASTGGGAGSRLCGFRTNGSGNGLGYNGTVTNQQVSLTSTGKIFLNLGDYLETMVKQFNTGAALLTDVTNLGNPRMSVRWTST
jgi:hypothetical protein